MSHWWEYPLSEILPFSLQAYYRLLQSYGEAIWPLQIPALAATGLLFWLIWNANGRRNACLSILLLAVAWLLVAWLFFEAHYALLFWAAPYFAIAFGLQACLLSIIAVICAQGYVVFTGQPRRQLATALFAFAVVGHPVITALTYERPVIEVLGFFPDPTALATVAALAGLKGFLRWVAMIIPVLWCVVTAAISLTLGGYEASTWTIIILLAALSITLAPERGSNQ